MSTYPNTATLAAFRLVHTLENGGRGMEPHEHTPHEHTWKPSERVFRCAHPANPGKRPHRRAQVDGVLRGPHHHPVCDCGTANSRVIVTDL